MNMSHIKKEYETPIDSNFYQNNATNSSLEELSNSQNTAYCIPRVIDNNSNLNKLYQNTINNIQQPKEKVWTIQLLLESPKIKNFQSPDLEIGFLIYSGAESNVINTHTWN